MTTPSPYFLLKISLDVCAGFERLKYPFLRLDPLSFHGNWRITPTQKFIFRFCLVIIYIQVTTEETWNSNTHAMPPRTSIEYLTEIKQN